MTAKAKVDFKTNLMQTLAKRGSVRALGYAAGGLRKTAVRSIKARQRTGRPSKPGMPPKTPTKILKKWLLYAVDKNTMTAVIGPVRLPRATGAPRTLEFGGMVRLANKRRRLRKVGGAGEIAIGGTVRANTKTVVVAGYSKSGRVRKRRVTYAKLRTAAMAARANRLNEELYGPKTATVRIDRRPFMKPALEKIVPSLPRHWTGSIR